VVQGLRGFELMVFMFNRAGFRKKGTKELLRWARKVPGCFTLGQRGLGGVACDVVLEIDQTVTNLLGMV